MDLKQKLVDWYNAHIVAAWYKSIAMWVGISATIVPYVPDWLQMALDHWDIASSLIPRLTPEGKAVMQGFILLVLLPAAKAWQQKSMRVAALKQAAEAGQISSRPDTNTIDIQVKGAPPVIVVPKVDPS